MDLIHRKYADPCVFMGMYIAQGRFGEFVAKVWGREKKDIREAFKKEEDGRLWMAYVHSLSEKTFEEWKAELRRPAAPASYALSDEQVRATVERSRKILGRARL